MQPIYLDYNATTPIDAEVADAMLPFLKEKFGNPSSSHWYGVQTKKAIENARKQVANLLGCHLDEIIFTSGGSESNNYAIKGYALANRDKGNHIITTAIEHPAVFEVCRYLADHGFRVTFLPVDEFGLIRLQDIEKAITADTILISVMHANNEVGSVQPIKEIAQITREKGIAFHTDAAQSVGKIPTDVNDLGVDMLSVAGHKLYAPKGIGALFIRRGIHLEKQIHGADHERNLRAGTENVLEIVGLGKACQVAGRDLLKNAAKMEKLRDRLHRGLAERIKNVQLNGPKEGRLSNTLSLGFKGLEADTILSELTGIAASAGAACHSDQVDVSHVLEAMKVPTEWAMGTIRFSVGKTTTEEEIDKAIEIVSETIIKLNGSGEEAPIPFIRTDIKLTHFTHGLGCACKLRPQALEKVLINLPKPTDERVLVGTESADDAAVYLLAPETAIVQTVDFFTPIVDDPYSFGAIAATNSLSDIYAMGGRPLFGLNIVGFPSNRLPMSVLETILKGAADKAKEAGISIIGGHTVDDTEPKYGLAVTGSVNPQKILRNFGAKPGDKILLTKPIGLGIIATAIKRGLAENETIENATEIMATLNRAAAKAVEPFEVHACTDVTGFGLLGHLSEMTRGSKVDARIHHDRVAIIEEAWEFAGAGIVPGGTLSNLDYVSKFVTWRESVPDLARTLLVDAQTSGGLLFAIPPDDAESALIALQKKCTTKVTMIGEFTAKGNGMIHVV
ncbi:MAG: selenide, water dikinase SelD [Calditrichaeota bacterium]|nr:selenide, water dikinase SelD [Calditrichota bacterium]